MYKVLYRKWRPQTFKDVVGQPQVTLTLEGEVLANRLSHAYLFTGSRGTGKTSCAKILSKAVNCLDIKEGNPCNECTNCKGIDNGSILDVLEIDAASNRGIDDIKALREDSAFTPAQAKYRVYIIDEVHMLTIEAFNALLKTLEEPPAHVIFILATTEVQKLPSTILSRCQRFDFRRIEPLAIANHLKYIAEEEGSSIDLDAAVLIARIADGALRDALSLLDRCISSSSKNIDTETVREIAGVIGNDFLFDISNAIYKKDLNRALLLADELHKASFDSERFCYELVNHFRNLMLVKTLKKPEEMIISTKAEIEALKNHTKLFSLEEIMRAIDVLSETAESLRQSKSGRIEVEAALIRLCSPRLDDDVSALILRISELEKAVKSLSSQPFKDFDKNLHKENYNDKINNSGRIGENLNPKSNIVNEPQNSDLPFAADDVQKAEMQNEQESQNASLPFAADNVQKAETQNGQESQNAGLPFAADDVQKAETQNGQEPQNADLPFAADNVQKAEMENEQEPQNADVAFAADDDFVLPFSEDSFEDLPKNTADDGISEYAPLPFDDEYDSPPCDFNEGAQNGDIPPCDFNEGAQNGEIPPCDFNEGAQNGEIPLCDFNEGAQNGESLPFGDDGFGDGSETSITEGLLPIAAWDNFYREAVKRIPMMCSMLKGTKGEIRGSVLIIKTPNPMTETFLKQNEDCAKGLVLAAKRTFNLDLNLKIELIT